jgi:hypothetical protein
MKRVIATEHGLKRAGVTTHTGRTADDPRRRTLQPAFCACLEQPAGAAGLRGSSVLALEERPCGVRGSAPLAPFGALPLVHTFELSRPLRERCLWSLA